MLYLCICIWGACFTYVSNLFYAKLFLYCNIDAVILEDQVKTSSMHKIKIYNISIICTIENIFKKGKHLRKEAVSFLISINLFASTMLMVYSRQFKRHSM